MKKKKSKSKDKKKARKIKDKKNDDMKNQNEEKEDEESSTTISIEPKKFKKKTYKKRNWNDYLKENNIDDKEYFNIKSKKVKKDKSREKKLKATNDKKHFEKKQNEFIDNFFAKNFRFDGISKKNDIFITILNKKMRISKDLITVEEDFILKVNSDYSYNYYNNFFKRLDAKIDNIISKEIYIDDKKVDDSSFDIKDYFIHLKFDKTFNSQTRKVRIIQKIKKQFDDYSTQSLILDKEGMAVRYLIYLDEDLNLDDISNKDYIIKKELNLVYFKGITTNKTENIHGYLNYSKKINFIIYKYIPDLSEDIIQNIIKNKESNKKHIFYCIAKYIKILITEYGQDIEEIILKKVSNYGPGEYLTYFSIGLYKDIKKEIDIAEINGKPYTYEIIDDSIKFDNIQCYNNQFMEIHLKYKYYTNENKNIYRQENILLSSLKNSFCKSIVQIPDNYIVISTDNIFKKSQEIKNRYIYEGIVNEDKISEMFKFCFEKAKWDIDYEYTLEAINNIKFCEFSMKKIFKGGNLNEIQYNISKEESNLVESEDNYTFKFENLNKNNAKINFNINIENSTSNYIFDEKEKYLTQIPSEEYNFFKNLANDIIKSDKTDFPDYKKIGKWVYNNIKYNKQLTGAKLTAMEIFKNKQGVCVHLTKLYNTLLTAYGIDAIQCSGYAKKITENNTKTEEGNNEENQNEKHAWTLAKIDGEWVPLDATWNLFEKKVPVTHIFKNYDDDNIRIIDKNNNPVQFTLTKESIMYV